MNGDPYGKQTPHTAGGWDSLGRSCLHRRHHGADRQHHRLAGLSDAKAFTNDAMLARLDRELLAVRDRVDRQRAEDRKSDADRLERIETDIRAMRDLMLDAFQRGRSY